MGGRSNMYFEFVIHYLELSLFMEDFYGLHCLGRQTNVTYTTIIGNGSDL